MGSKGEKDKQKQIQDKCQALLNGMLRDEDNKYCVDCDSKGPRWASWNLGVFLCIRCAGIHRNLGVHISKVKSVNLDSWTPEQVVSLQQMGNSRARAVYEANLPDNFRRPQSDSSLESFIRAKYEHKKYIAREWVPPQIPKVDWEKEIDEEIERQRKKKKAAAADKKTAIKLPATAEVPQIPKPKSSASPKPARSTPQEPQKHTQDLLGLQNGDDGFSGFLSASTNVETVKKDEITDAVKAEEKNFFNQPAPSEKERSKMTKDSIMALYGNTPQQPIVYPQVGAFQQGVAPNAFPQTYQYPPQGFASTVPQNFTPQPYVLQNGTHHMPNMAQNLSNMTHNMPNMVQNVSNMAQNVPNMAHTVPNMASNVSNMVSNVPNMVSNVPNMVSNVPNMVSNVPNMVSNVSTMASNVPNMVTNMPYMAQQAAAMQYTANQQFMAPAYGQAFGAMPQGQFQAPMGPTVPMATPANPFCGTMPLQQQFAGLNLTGAPVNNSNVGKPATANIWQ